MLSTGVLSLQSSRSRPSGSPLSLPTGPKVITNTTISVIITVTYSIKAPAGDPSHGRYHHLFERELGRRLSSDCPPKLAPDKDRAIRCRCQQQQQRTWGPAGAGGANSHSVSFISDSTCRQPDPAEATRSSRRRRTRRAYRHQISIPPAPGSASPRRRMPSRPLPLIHSRRRPPLGADRVGWQDLHTNEQEQFEGSFKLDLAAWLAAASQIVSQTSLRVPVSQSRTNRRTPD